MTLIQSSNPFSKQYTILPPRNAQHQRSLTKQQPKKSTEKPSRTGYQGSANRGGAVAMRGSARVQRGTANMPRSIGFTNAAKPITKRNLGSTLLEADSKKSKELFQTASMRRKVELAARGLADRHTEVPGQDLIDPTKFAGHRSIPKRASSSKSTLTIHGVIGVNGKDSQTSVAQGQPDTLIGYGDSTTGLYYEPMEGVMETTRPGQGSTSAQPEAQMVARESTVDSWTGKFTSAPLSKPSTTVGQNMDGNLQAKIGLQPVQRVSFEVYRTSRPSLFEKEGLLIVQMRFGNSQSSAIPMFLTGLDKPSTSLCLMYYQRLISFSIESAWHKIFRVVGITSSLCFGPMEGLRLILKTLLCSNMLLSICGFLHQG
jgi:hypothetical protein